MVQWLWQVVGELTQEERKLFLKFFTGSDRAPIGGLGNLRCLIQVGGLLPAGCWPGCQGAGRAGALLGLAGAVPPICGFAVGHAVTNASLN